eukprot:TRINITY_DN8604_c0_g1_i2.p2 TRINITY_DN8604_c0_g1~~TRINITY_DN8604_c0_g1_i2.p2  ORF type:complete len:388 (-),score=56.71 TRINITY_DN8604_c0_g1_i2:178-1248(-)
MENIVALLSECKLEAVAHRQQGMLLKISEKNTVQDALQVLQSKNVLSIPVVDANDQFSGVLSVADVLRALVNDLNLANTRRSFDMDASSVTSAMAAIFRRPVAKVMHSGDLWYLEGHDQASVMDAVKDMLMRSSVHHRLFTCKTLKDTSPTGILSQSDIVRLIWDHKVELGDVLHNTVESMGLCASAAETEVASATTLKVLTDMWLDHKTCMGITDGHGQLIGNLSLSDLRALTIDKLHLLCEPVGAFLLALRDLPVPEGDVDWSVALRACPVHIVTPQTRFEQVLQALTLNKLHRLYVVDHVEHSIGIITLTDVLRTLLPKEPAMPMEGKAGGLPSSHELGDSPDVELAPEVTVA